ncbi:MAG: flagellar motor switch protein FliG [Oscillospiraceae bacterium]|jgi:flagellar motor switch protein FliG|nr:flagellar motor switch protein FliG [Oscillospiraceae bacterium]
MATVTMTPVMKAAAVLIALGRENASEVYKFLHEEEVEELSFHISRIDGLSSEELDEIMNDFYEMCITQKIVTEGGETYARDILEKAFGPQKALQLMDKIIRSGRTKAFEFLRKADYKNLLMIVQNEYPQTIALILSHCSADMASQIIVELPKDIQIEVFQRISNLDRASPEVINIVENILRSKLDSMSSVDVMEAGGVSYLADIMNHVDRRTEKYIFDELNDTNPELADQIKKLMFVFEDIVYLDNMEIQFFLRECDTKDITVALKSASEEITNAIFSNMSQRQQETIRTDMMYLHNVRMRDVEEAQQRIVAVIRRLEESGEIVISKGGKDEIIA